MAEAARSCCAVLNWTPSLSREGRIQNALAGPMKVVELTDHRNEPLWVPGSGRSKRVWSAVDDGHVSLLMAFARSRGEVVEPLDLLRAQLDSVGCGVLFDAGDALGAGDRGDVVALREEPGQRGLCWCCIELGGDGLDLVDDAEVLLEVALGEARVVLAPVVVGEILGGADRPGEEAVPER